VSKLQKYDRNHYDYKLISSLYHSTNERITELISAGWIPVDRNNAVKWNWINAPLQIRLKNVTDHANKALSIRFVVAGESNFNAGRVTLNNFTLTSVRYDLGYCHQANVKNPAFKDAFEENSICTITRTEKRVSIECKDVQVVDFVLSNQSCSKSEAWEKYWKLKVDKFNVIAVDTVSGFYRAKPGNFPDKIALMRYPTVMLLK
jgi:hypothetical protein